MSRLDRGIARALVLALAALVALGFAGCDSYERKHAEILFSRGAQGSLYVLDEATGTTRQFAATKDLWWIETAQWSADGDQIVLTGHEAPPAIQYGTGEVIELVKKDGHGRLVVAGGEGQANVSPAWSPDGKKIAFVQHVRDDRPRAARIAVVQADGQHLRAFPKTAIYDRFTAIEPRWRPSTCGSTGRTAALSGFGFGRFASQTAILFAWHS